MVIKKNKSRSKTMRSKSMRMRGKSMRMRSKTMRGKSMRGKSMRGKQQKNKTLRRKYRGGGISAWYGGDVGTWPGVSGDHSGIFLPLSPNGIPVSLEPPMPSNSQFNNNQKGGGFLTNLMPQDLVNFGRSLTGGVERGMNSIQGVKSADNTYVYPEQQPKIMREIQSANSYNNPIINMKQINANVENKVANI
jgi:hypothetical protein